MSDELFYVDALGKKGDADLHRPLLSEHAGAIASDLAAIRQAVAAGEELRRAAELYGSIETREWLAAHSYL